LIDVAVGTILISKRVWPVFSTKNQAQWNPIYAGEVTTMHDSDKPVTTMDEILHPGTGTGGSNPDFPDAPGDWSLEQARQVAANEGLELEQDHLDLIRALQTFFQKHEQDTINLRELHDALDERFHKLGGLKYLYEIIPGGPVAQGCLLAGLKPPPGSKDLSYGSVV